MMRGLRFIIRLIAGGAVLLPLLALGHGTEFLDARFELRDGVLRLRIVADYVGNPMIADEAEARKVVADALRIEVGASKTPHRLDELAPLQIVERGTRDALSPMPRTEADDPKQPHQLLSAYWRWSAPDGEVRFFVPETSQQSVLFWLREPNISPPRWSLMVPGDRTPVMVVKHPWRSPFWLWGVISVGVLFVSVLAIRLLLRRSQPPCAGPLGGQSLPED
jgi:hypothetical protein